MYLFFVLIASYGVWFILSGYTTSYFLICGGITAFITLVVLLRMKLPITSRLPLYLNPRMFTYSLWLMKEIWVSAVNVSKIVWSVNPPIKPKLEWIESIKKCDRSKAVYANSITLTPGTLCTNIKEDMVQVHALHADGIADLREGTMDRKSSAFSGCEE